MDRARLVALGQPCGYNFEKMSERDVWRPPAAEDADWVGRGFAELSPEEQREILLQAGEPQRDYAPIQPPSPWRSLARKLWAPIAGLAALLAKFKFVLIGIAKFKVFTVAASMLVSVGAYALLGGWWFGLGLVLLIFAHEMGHVLELRRQGVPASAPLFIPFMGAVVGMKQLPKNAWREAQVALAGPLLGSLAAAGVLAAGELADSRFLKALAFVGFLINLFNLLPVVPLDGGRAAAALHPAIWLLGLLGLGALAYLRPNPILLFILLLGGVELWRRWQVRYLPEFRRYYEVRPWQRAVVAAVYLGLAAALALGMHASHVPRKF